MVQLSNFKHQALDCPHREQIEDLIAISTQRNYKPGWVGFQVMKLPGLGLDDLRYTAIRLGYHRNWAIHAWVELQSQTAS